MLKLDAAVVIRRLYSDAGALHTDMGWHRLASIGRVYDAGLVEREFGFRCRINIAAVLSVLRSGRPLPFQGNPTYVSPKDAILERSSLVANSKRLAP
jgi:UDP-glucose 4-epimerase